MHQQPNISPLFTLPLEVRLLIYELAIGGNTYHVAIKHSRRGLGRVPPMPASIRLKVSLLDAMPLLDAMVDPAAPELMACSISGDSKKEWEKEMEEGKEKGKEKEVRGPLALVLVCWDIHNEALPLLYSTQTFDPVPILLPALPQPHPSLLPRPLIPSLPPTMGANHLPHLQHLTLPTHPTRLLFTSDFLTTIPAPCLSRIKTLRLDCCDRRGLDVRSHLQQGRHFRGVWGCVWKFGGLRELRVGVCGWRVPGGWRREVLGPMVEAAEGTEASRDVSVKGKERGKGLDLKGLEVWTVSVPWTAEVVAEERKRGLPFELVAWTGPQEGGEGGDVADATATIQ